MFWLVASVLILVPVCDDYSSKPKQKQGKGKQGEGSADGDKDEDSDEVDKHSEDEDEDSEEEYEDSLEEDDGIRVSCFGWLHLVSFGSALQGGSLYR